MVLIFAQNVVLYWKTRAFQDTEPSEDLITKNHVLFASSLYEATRAETNICMQTDAYRHIRL